MKPAFVSFVFPLLFLSPPDQGQQAILVTGRVTDSTSSAGLQAANVRVSDAGVSVGTDAAGMYRSCCRSVTGEGRSPCRCGRSAIARNRNSSGSAPIR